MAPIDPAQLLKALAPLLSDTGGIRDAGEVKRLSSLIKRFSRKLVSRCMYCCVLKATSPEILEIYLEQDGWSTLLMWIDEARDNTPFLKELLELLDKLPMNIERLKANSIAKTVKNLGKHEDTDLAQQAEALVSKWKKLVTALEDGKEKRKDRKDKDKAKKSDDHKKKDDKDRHKHKSSSSSRSDKDRKDRKDKKKDDKKEIKGEKRKETDDREKLIQKKIKTEPDSEEMLTDVVPPRPPTPPELRKPKSERPKTVKEFGSKLRLASFLENDSAPARTQKKKSAKSGTTSNTLSKPPIPLSSLRTLNPGGVRATLMNAHLNQTEQQVGNIKIIAPKAPHLIVENDIFLNAISDKPTGAKKKKKVDSKKTSPELKRENSKDEMTADEEMETVEHEQDTVESIAASNSAEDGVKPKEEPPKLSFYKDTLEETEEVPRRSLRSRTRKAIIDENSDGDDDDSDNVQRMGDDAAKADQIPEAPQDEEANNKEDSAEPDEEEGISVVLQTHNKESDSGVKSILNIVMNKNRVKKNVRWKEDNDLKTFHFFEHDPNERINVNNINHMQQALKVDGSVDIKMIEMRMERERLRSPNDRMEEQQQWRIPALIEIPLGREPLMQFHEIGKNSELRKIEAARQATVLEVIYFNRRMIPDSPSEPDPENRRSSIDSNEPRLIPLEDIDAFPQPQEIPTWQQQDHAPESNSGLPPALSSLLANMGVPGHLTGPPEIPIIPQGPPEHFSGNAMPPGPVVPGSLQGPPEMGPPAFMRNNGGPHSLPPPPRMMHMMPPGPDPEGGHWGPMGSGPPPLGPPLGLHSGNMPPHERRRHGRGAGNPVPGNGGNGARNIMRGPPRTLCKFFKQGHCRFGASCTFLHPGVNGPEMR